MTMASVPAKVRNPVIGYCQSMNFIVATFLLLPGYTCSRSYLQAGVIGCALLMAVVDAKSIGFMV